MIKRVKIILLVYYDDAAFELLLTHDKKSWIPVQLVIYQRNRISFMRDFFSYNIKLTANFVEKSHKLFKT